MIQPANPDYIDVEQLNAWGKTLLRANYHDQKETAKDMRRFPGLFTKDNNMVNIEFLNDPHTEQFKTAESELPNYGGPINKSPEVKEHLAMLQNVIREESARVYQQRLEDFRKKLETWPVSITDDPTIESIELGPLAIDEARRITLEGERQDNYGHPIVNFLRIAIRWTALLWSANRLTAPITPVDVAMMMSDLKVAREHETPGVKDNVVDYIGYASCWDRINRWMLAAGYENGAEWFNENPLDDWYVLLSKILDGVYDDIDSD